MATITGPINRSTLGGKVFLKPQLLVDHPLEAGAKITIMDHTQYESVGPITATVEGHSDAWHSRVTADGAYTVE